MICLASFIRGRDQSSVGKGIRSGNEKAAPAERCGDQKRQSIGLK